MTRMFNAYISSISSSITWGGDGGSCQMTLVEDPENKLITDPKKKVIAKIPSVGTPVFIARDKFYFGGLLQRATYKESISGRTFDITIESGAKLLDGIQVILSDFNGSWFSSSDIYNPTEAIRVGNNFILPHPDNVSLYRYQIPNIYNVYAHYENINNNGFFGNSGLNSAGMPAYKVLTAIELLSRGNNPIESIFSGKVKFGTHEYTLDLSELTPYFNGVNFRLKGPVQSLSSIVQECCDAAGLDYYVELKGSVTNQEEQDLYDLNVLSNTVIKIRTIQRGYQPATGIIPQFIRAARDSGTLISADYGNEWANTTAQKLVVGGPASRFLIQTISTAIPVWGKLQNNTYIFGARDPQTGFYLTAPVAYALPFSPVPVSLDEYSTATQYKASILELRMALGGKDCWEVFKSFETIFGVEQNGYNNIQTCPWSGALEANIDLFNRIATGKATSIDLQPTSSSYTQKRFYTQLTELSDMIYAAVSRVATNYYGQVFAIPLQAYEPGGANANVFDNNIRFIVEDIQYETQWEISDSAFYPERVFADLNFYDGEGRLRGGAAWPSSNRYDYSALGGDWALTPDGGIATNKGGPDKEIYWDDTTNKPYIIVRSGGQVLDYDGFTTPDFGLTVLYYIFTLAKYGSAQFLNPISYLTSGAQNVQISVPPNVALPTSFGIPQQSKTYSWGPWWAWSGQFPSKSEVIFDESLRPETFGSTYLLDQAGFATAASGLSDKSIGINETGTIELVGSPSFNIAERLSVSGPYITGIDINIGPDGEKVTYKFSSWTNTFGKMSKSNIDRIANIYKGSLALAQRTRSQIQKRPLPKIKFEKSDLGELAARYKQQSPNMIHSFINSLI
jgi:hypothetical protein